MAYIQSFNRFYLLQIHIYGNDPIRKCVFFFCFLRFMEQTSYITNFQAIFDADVPWLHTAAVVCQYEAILYNINEKNFKI